jgi:hypothetical protein
MGMLERQQSTYHNHDLEVRVIDFRFLIFQFLAFRILEFRINNLEIYFIM